MDWIKPEFFETLQFKCIKNWKRYNILQYSYLTIDKSCRYETVREGYSWLRYGGMFWKLKKVKGEKCNFNFEDFRLYY